MANIQKVFSRVSKSSAVTTSSTSDQQKIPVVDLTKAAPVLGAIVIDQLTKFVFYGDGVSWVQLQNAP